MEKKKKLFPKYNYGIMARIVILFMVLVVVPYVIVSLLLSINFLKYGMNSVANTTATSLEVAADRISDMIDEYEDASMMSYYNYIPERLAEQTTLSADEVEDMKMLFESICYSEEGIRGVYLMFQNQIIIGGQNYETVTNIIQNNEKMIYDSKGRPVWFASNEIFGKEKENRYIMARALNDTEGNPVALFYMLIDGKKINETMSTLSDEISTVYIVSDDDKIFYSSKSSEINSTFESGMTDSTKLNRNERVTIDGNRYQLVDSYLPEIKWHCISLISVKGVHGQIIKVETPFLLCSVFYGVFLLIMLFMMKKYIFSPLQKLNVTMEEYAQKEIKTTNLSIEGVAEFKNLSIHFNEMTQRISDLVEAYKHEEDEKNRQKIQTLTAQLTPHFIYNALNTIKWVAALNHQENIQHLTESLIFIFMNAARVENEQYSLKDEIELVKNYAVIQKARFMNFELVTKIEPQTLKLHVRKLSIQPIVENAIVHGLKRGKLKSTIIEVRAWIDNDFYIEVQDEGVGFDVEKWRNEPRKDNTHTNIGLKNVEEMIKLEFGSDYGMKIQSSPGDGTLIQYHLPAIQISEVSQ